MILELHVGLPKCGSTTIQTVLGNQREALAARGIWYPPSLMPGDKTTNTDLPGHWIEGRIGVDTVLTPSICERFSRVILSSEFIAMHWHRFSEDALRHMRGWLESRQVELRIFAVTRPRDELFAALYKQTLVNQPYFAALAADFSAPVLDFDEQKFGRLQQALGASSCHVYRLEEPGWLEALSTKLAFDVLAKGQRENRSLSDASAEILRQFNAMADEGPSRQLVARALVLATRSTHALLMRQALKPVRSDPRRLRRAHIWQLRFVDNPPLRFTRDEFEKCQTSLLQVLTAHPHAFTLRPQYFSRLMQEMGPSFFQTEIVP